MIYYDIIEMSALLNHNERPEISWKGRTLNQITSTIQKNSLSNGTVSGDNIFRAMPLKIYRREIATNIQTNARRKCANSRVSSSIDELTRPGGFVLPKSTVNADTAGQLNTLEYSAPGNLNETYGCSRGGAKTSYNCAEDNARRRCRSSGVIKRVYDPARSEIAYFTNTNQYLVSRSKTFLQNQYRHVRPNDNSVVTNPLTNKEIYSPNGISHCAKAYIASDSNLFYYYWIDASGSAGDFLSTTKRYTVTITPGYYDVHSLNVEFENAMYLNGHYYVYSATHSNIFLMKMIYNNANDCIEIQAFSTATVSNAKYSRPANVTWQTPTVPVVPVYYIPPTKIQNIIGFSNGFYPNVIEDPNANATSNGMSYGALSNLSHSIYPSYSITYYKPSNNRFAVQGGVSSSDMTQRVKYETITRNGLAYATAYGAEVGSAMSYGVRDKVYTVKDKIGYPLTKTPVIDKYTGEMRCLAKVKGT
jgi:hypothetical protein